MACPGGVQHHERLTNAQNSAGSEPLQLQPRANLYNCSLVPRPSRFWGHMVVPPLLPVEVWACRLSCAFLRTCLRATEFLHLYNYKPLTACSRPKLAWRTDACVERKPQFTHMDSEALVRELRRCQKKLQRQRADTKWCPPPSLPSLLLLLCIHLNFLCRAPVLHKVLQALFQRRQHDLHVVNVTSAYKETTQA